MIRTGMNDAAFDSLSRWADENLTDDEREQSVTEIIELWETANANDRMRWGHDWEHMANLLWRRRYDLPSIHLEG